jgi:L-alanine-DL-glutamate epimerase-like enolase superfamily enzyme
MEIVDYRLRGLELPTDRPIGDSQVGPVTEYRLAYLELEADTGAVGVGVDGVEGGLAGLVDRFAPRGEALRGASPFAARNRPTRPRGGDHRRARHEGEFDLLVDMALWDLCGKQLGLSVAELMGATEDRVPAYASGLAYHLDDEATRAHYRRFGEMGLTAAKVKVGFPTVEGDLARLDLVEAAMGADRLLVDANEAFTPKEAIRRARAYREAGFDVYWFEDPVLRDDVAGLGRVAAAIDAHVNVGEYVGSEGKRELLERGAADVLNCHGLTSARRAATLAEAWGRPVSVGNTPADVGVHAAAALPECVYVECARTGWQHWVPDPVDFEDGHAVVPEGPGHGLAFEEDVLAAHARG